MGDIVSFITKGNGHLIVLFGVISFVLTEPYVSFINYYTGHQYEGLWVTGLTLIFTSIMCKVYTLYFEEGTEIGDFNIFKFKVEVEYEENSLLGIKMKYWISILLIVGILLCLMALILDINLILKLK